MNLELEMKDIPDSWRFHCVCGSAAFSVYRQSLALHKPKIACDKCARQ